MTDDPGPDPSPSPSSSRRWLPVLLGAALVLLVVVGVVVAVSGGDDEGTDVVRSTGDGPACTADALLAAVDGDVKVAGDYVSEFECTPETAPLAARYAWAQLSHDGSNPPRVYFAGVGRDGDEWRMIGVGNDVFCDDLMPQAACDLLPGALRP